MKKWMALLAAVCMLLSCLSAFAETASGVYTFHEQINPFLAIDWTVTLNEDGSYVIEFTKPTGVTYAYTGTWEQKPDGAVVTGTPNESTADIEADFFRDDFSAVWVIDGETIVPKNDGAGSAGANAHVGGFAGAMGSRENPGHPVSDVLPDALAGRTFAYDEVVAAFGFTVHWTLTFDDENTATLISPNDVMGDSVYACSWAFDDGLIVTRIEEVVKGQAPLADFFDAQNGFECRWVLTDADSSMMPLSLAGSNAAVPAQSGLPGNQGAAAADADYANIAYASESSAQICDIYLPEGERAHPVIVLVHGGGFMFGDQRMPIIQPVIEAGVANGYAVVSVDYRKSSEAVFPAALADVKAAVRFIRENAGQYGFDPEHIAVWGESAGAYLALMTALTPDVAELNGDVAEYVAQPASVTALVDFYGPVQFAAMQAEAADLGFSFGGSFECQFVGVSSLDDEKVAATWWETYADQLPEGFALKAWIQAGNADTSVPYTQSVNLAERLSAVIGEKNVRFGVLEGATHEDAAFYTDENLAAVFAFLDTCMK
ncbi:MAG: alpha/beta fold hydrolase [Aristaeellaceae bacterium]